jgi:hypothetical protein
MDWLGIEAVCGTSGKWRNALRFSALRVLRANAAERQSEAVGYHLSGDGGFDKTGIDR